LRKRYFLDSSIESFLNSFNNFSISKVDLRALAPAAFTPLSIKDSVSAVNAKLSVNLCY
jgi:hypothetical protein